MGDETRLKAALLILAKNIRLRFVRGYSEYEGGNFIAVFH